MNDPVRRDEKGEPVDDGSAVRERSTRPTSSLPPASIPARTAVSMSAGAARERLEQKIKKGRALLANLPAGDDRARLLHVALMRRDESLLDGVLASLGVKDSTPPRSR